MQNLFARSLSNKENSIPSNDFNLSYKNDTAKNDLLKSQKKESKNSYRFTITQANTDAEDAKSSMTTTQLDLHFTRNIQPQLSIDFQPGFQFNTGSIQKIDSVDKPVHRLVFSNAQMTYSGFAYLTGGAINQSQFHNSLLIDAEALPTIAIGLSDHAKNKLLVTSTQLEFINRSSINGEFQGIPNLTSLVFQYQPIKYLSLKAGIFEISHSNNLIMGQVLKTGNNYLTVSDGVYQLAHEFTGTEIQANIYTDYFNKFDFELTLEALNNQRADTRENSSFLVGTVVNFNTSLTSKISYLVQYFETEPEATMGHLIESKGLGNRVGLNQELSFLSKNMGIKMSFGYRQLIPMYNQTLQTEEKQLSFKLETLYVEN